MPLDDGRPFDPGAAPPFPNGRRLSVLLRELAGDAGRERISAGDMLDAFGARAFGALLVVFAAPNMLPLPLPGLSALTGAPLILLSWQLMQGRPKPWLPAVLRDRSFARADFLRMVERLTPVLDRIERMARPRLLPLTEAAGERAFGFLAVALSAVLFLPLPFGNFLPGLALSVAGIGLAERDGVAILAGVAVGLLGLLVVSGSVYAIALAAVLLIQHLLGL
jgi:hypothetical protein